MEILVFISWSGEWGKPLAEHLADTIFKYSPLKSWISSRDIPPGENWYDATMKASQQAKIGVVCLTPGASKSSWLNFETGLLVARLEKIKIINFGERLIEPLKRYQAIEAANRDDWVKLLQDMNSEWNNKMCQALVNGWFPDWQKFLAERTRSPHVYFRDIGNILGRVHDEVETLNSQNAYVKKNLCFQRVIYDSYSQLYERSRNIESTFSLPASQYPLYLISLQRNLENCYVKAIALVNVEEQFWSQPMGREILTTSCSENIRVFAFFSEKEFDYHLATLREHSKKYNVYAISLAKLSDVLGANNTKDFSIIEVSGSKLLAVYDDDNTEEKNISFIADPNMIAQHEELFEKLLSSKIPVFIPPHTIQEKAETDSLRARIFKDLVPYERKLIEMSEYIDVIPYDEHEEKHAYYQDMMSKMIEIFLEHSSNNSSPIRILELGAGTGIFTVRLNKITNVTEIVAVEIDWHCYQILKGKFREQYKKVKTLNKDSRTYNPEGEFDYIFSSFADHHIKTADKAKYFDNIKQNLKPNGLMIVGDEFLRKHDPNDRDDRDSALKDYHSHIIDIAKGQGEMILAELERQALQSGLEEKGDFKVSCEQYEELLKQAKFKFKKEKIGPENIDNIGGVYVYTAWLPT